MKKATPVLLFLLLLSFGTLFAQGSGRITGTVTDVTTGTPLFGANVFLKGVSIGAATDLDGKYTITQIPAGDYLMAIRYIGYQEKELEVTVQANKTIVIDVEIEAEVIEGEQVVVTSQALGQKQAINRQLTSNTITSVVSADKIQELPDGNASSALSRLPGISLQDGDKVVVRGIQSKMNVILVNGVQLPSTDINDRSTNLGFISSNMLAGIEVTKAVTPDQDASAIGGVVNLKLREAPENFHFDVLAQGSYNTQDKTTDNYKFWASVSNRFFDNKLGVFIQGNADRSNTGNDRVNAGFEQMAQGGEEFGMRPYRMNNFSLQDELNVIQNYGGSVILDYVLPHGKIILQNTLAITNNDMARFTDQYNINDSRRIFTINRDIHDKTLMVNSLQFDYLIGDYKVDLGLSHSFSDKETDLRYGDPGEEFGFSVNQGIPSYIFNNRNWITIDNITALKVDEDPLYKDLYKTSEIYGWAMTRDENFNQHLYSGNIDFTIPVSFSTDITSKFKLGARVNHSQRTNELESTYQRTGEVTTMNAGAYDYLISIGADPNSNIKFIDFRDNDYTRGEEFLDGDIPMVNVFNLDRLDQFMRLSSPKWKPGRHKLNSVRRDFDGKETYSAGYLMGEFNIGQRLSLITGVRYENMNMDYNSIFFLVSHSVDGLGNIYDTLNTIKRENSRFFPNAQIRYKFTDWFDARFAYTNTISRPDYSAILPNTIIESNMSATAGNPKLKPTISTNYDLFLSFYNNEIGLFTVGGFFKKIDNIFYAQNIYIKNIEDFDVPFPSAESLAKLKIPAMLPSARLNTTINNNNPAYVKGIEIDWQTSFWYLPSPFNSLVLNVNYTRTWSEMDYRKILNRERRIRNEETGRYVTEYYYIDTVRNARLLYQGDNILNVALGFDYKGLSARISFNMQGDVITNVGDRPEDDNFTGNYYKWDFTLQQKLPIDGLSIAFNGTNIFHNSVKTYREFYRKDSGRDDKIETLSSISYSPRILELALRYSM